ncbi:predicted protein [Sparassis crispa]|uniref:Uncharacterized protein n=1 Tax=Sparassis crispa TaxID=139825 RepID=A0A401GNF3_9APHY|nr:predicted protein [Sparassis crispa]GBE83748.1 predicted protein [Sparassis crispa]
MQRRTSLFEVGHDQTTYCAWTGEQMYKALVHTVKMSNSNASSSRAIPGRILHHLSTSPRSSSTQPQLNNECLTPSEGWLREPAWIDGGVKPPHFYHTHAEIVNAVHAAANGGIHIPTTSRDQPPLVPVRSLAAPLDALRPPSVPLVAIQPRAPPLAAAAELQIRPTAATPLEGAGHIISITHVFTLPEMKTVSSRGSKAAAPKPTMNIRFEHIVLEGIGRTGFMQAFLAVHDLADQFSPGVHLGPDFKLWWMGSSGGKTRAPTIENDHQFKVALGALLKKKGACQVGMKFNTDQMDGYRIQKLVPLVNPDLNAAEDELLYGTKVPHIESFSAQSQLHGAIIMQLKDKWSCQQHSGEHGESGYCYVTPNAEHIGMNTRKLKSWASAIAAADATKHEPPHTLDFDGTRNGCHSAVRSRGRTGSHADSTPTPSSSFTDPSALLMAAILPLITGLSCKHDHSPSPMPVALNFVLA